MCVFVQFVYCICYNSSKTFFDYMALLLKTGGGGWEWGDKLLHFHGDF